MNDKRILIISHFSEIYGPVQVLVSYCRGNMAETYSILHPLPQSKIRYSELTSFRDSRNETTQFVRDYKLSELFSYGTHLILDLYIILRQRKKFDVNIGIDNLNALAGIIFRKLGIVNKTIFYVIDYTPKRFKNPVMNCLYHSLDRFCVVHSDYIWNISERISGIREKQGVERRKNLIIPVGIEFGRIRDTGSRSVNRTVLVFVGHLEKSKGVDLLIEAMTDIVRTLPHMKMEIIGVGPHENILKELVRKLGLDDHVKFLGLMDHSKLLDYLSTCGIALATYTQDPNNITYYADPTKPKEYLACGLPVIITRVPWIAKYIDEKPMGIAINYNKEELVQAVVKLSMNDAFYYQCKKNALDFVKDLSWENIFSEAFQKSIDN